MPNPTPHPDDDRAERFGEQQALAWLRDYAAGRQVGARQLVEHYLPRLHRLAWRLLDDAAEAEDVCQEAFMKLWQQAPNWRAEARIGTWLHQVTLNAARDRLRRRRGGGTSEVEVADLVDHGPQSDPERLAAESESQRWLAQAIEQLPPRQREALLLCHDQQLSQKEAAEVMEIDVGALESLLSRARQALRQAAQAREGEHER